MLQHILFVNYWYFDGNEIFLNREGPSHFLPAFSPSYYKCVDAKCNVRILPISVTLSGTGDAITRLS